MSRCRARRRSRCRSRGRRGRRSCSPRSRGAAAHRALGRLDAATRVRARGGARAGLGARRRLARRRAAASRRTTSVRTSASCGRRSSPERRDAARRAPGRHGAAPRRGGGRSTTPRSLGVGLELALLGLGQRRPHGVAVPERADARRGQGLAIAGRTRARAVGRPSDDDDPCALRGARGRLPRRRCRRRRRPPAARSPSRPPARRRRRSSAPRTARRSPCSTGAAAARLGTGYRANVSARLFWIGWLFHLKGLTNSLFFVLLSLIQPVIFASIAFFMVEIGEPRGNAPLRRARRRADGHLVGDAVRLGRRDPVAALAGHARAHGRRAAAVRRRPAAADDRDVDDGHLLGRGDARLGTDVLRRRRSSSRIRSSSPSRSR